MKTTLNLFRTLPLLAGLLAVSPGKAATAIWSGAGGNDNWSTAGNWSGATPASGNGIFFNDTDATGGSGQYGSPNSILDNSFTVLSLTYGNSNGFHNTQIPLGLTLTVVSNVLAGTDTDAGGIQTVYATIGGQGTLLVTNTSAQINVRQGSATSGGHLATLDLEGLDTFTAYVSQIRIGADNRNSTYPQYNRGQGTLLLAKTNFVYCSSAVGTPGVILSESQANGGTCALELGQTNAIFSDAGITVGSRKAVNSSLSFNSDFAGNSPAVLFRNRAGTGRQAMWIIGDQYAQNSGSTGSSGTIDLSNGTVDALVNTNIIGRGPISPGTGTGTGTLTFSAGIIDVNAMDLGVQPSGGGAGNGTVNVNGTGRLLVNTLMRLAVGPSASGTLYVNGGTVRANALASGGGRATVSVSGGALAVTNAAGSAATPLSSFYIGDAHLGLGLGTGPTLFVSDFSVVSTTTIDILSPPSLSSYPAQFPLISYVSYAPSGGTDFVLGTVAGGAYTGYISNNTASSTLDLVITAGPPPARSLTWNGNVDGNWNISTANWRYQGGSSAYNQNDMVTFDDTASGTTTVTLAMDVTPGSLTITNSSKSYTFTGPGTLGGAGGLLKAGSGQLTLANSGTNSFAGGFSIQGGKVQLGAANVLPATAAVTLADEPTAALDLNHQNQTLQSLSGGGSTGGNVTLGSATLTLLDSGTYAGVLSGPGRLVKANPPGAGGGNQVLSGANSYSGGTIIGGMTNTTRLSVANQSGSGTGSGFVQVLTNGTLSLGNGGAGGSVAALAITNEGTVRLDRSDDFTLPNLIVGPGTLDKRNTNIVTLAGDNPYTGFTSINAGALRMSAPGALGTPEGTTWVGNDPTARLELAGGITTAEPLSLSCKQTAAGNVPVLVNVSGTNVLTGPISLTTGGSFWTLEVDADRLVITGNLTNITTSNTRTVRLRGAAGTGEILGAIMNSTSNLSVTAVIKEEPGTWILSGTNTYTGSTTVNDGTLLVNGALANNLGVTVAGGVLGGTGTLNGATQVGAGGTLAPGKAGIGALTVNHNLSLSGMSIMEVSHGGCDQVLGVGTLTLGGTLQVVVQGALTGGEVFKLFTATTVSGDFAVYDLPALPAPLSWDTSQVAVDGTLKVAGTLAPPPPATISSAVRSGNNLTLVWAGGTNRSCVLLTATNVAQPPATWQVVVTNVVAADGLSTNTLPMNPGEPKRFYLLAIPAN